MPEDMVDWKLVESNDSLETFVVACRGKFILRTILYRTIYPSDGSREFREPISVAMVRLDP